MSDFALSDLTGGPVPADQRGSLEVREKAIERIVEQAALGVAGTVRYSTRLDRIRRRRYPSASVAVERSRARVDLDIAAAWPCRAAEVVKETRDRVRSEATRLSGIDVASVDVRLHVLGPDRDQPVRRVQ